MKILAPPTLQRHHTPAVAERPRAVAPARLGGRPGISRSVLNDLRKAANRDALARAYDPNGIPPGFQRRVIDLALFAASFTTVEENLAAIDAERDRLGAHAVAMVLRPVAARIAALLGTEDASAVTR